MNEKQERDYHARGAIAQLFCSWLNHDGERAKLMERLGVRTLPVILPAFGDTLATLKTVRNTWSSQWVFLVRGPRAPSFAY
ncbi:hypothetical protein SAMN05660282_00829 [Corynebacterium spheniscorum]|uniref:Uncharacterized protein n=1 Tax=Corynebacterium spheniscorum TaxID=185761 RepID=A0A1I2RPD9_9CORY|nr:hypothetical protein SAMN05660282_00829 [Corynebacterium spheniscorum]